MVALEKNFRIEICRNRDGSGEGRVRLAFLPDDGSAMSLTAQQARALATDLIKAAFLADARASLGVKRQILDEAAP